jgi:hypothetical protein
LPGVRDSAAIRSRLVPQLKTKRFRPYLIVTLRDRNRELQADEAVEPVIYPVVKTEREPR